MRDLELWRMLEFRPVPADAAAPLLAKLAAEPVQVRMPFLARLLSLTKQADVTLRAAALRALGGASGGPVFQALVKGLHDDDAEVRQAALDALQRSSGDDPPRLVHALFHRDPLIRSQAVRAKSMLAHQGMTLYLLPDAENAPAILADLPTLGLPADAVPAMFDMLAAGSITPTIARDVLLRMRPADFFERLQQGRARVANVMDTLLQLASGPEWPAPDFFAANDDAFDDAVDLFFAVSDHEERDSQRFCEQLIAWLSESPRAASPDERKRVACALLRRLVLDWNTHPDLLRTLIVAWPGLVACEFLPKAARRNAAFVFYERKDKLRKLPAAELKDILDRTAPLRPSFNLDLRFIGALGRLLEGSSTLQQMIDWYGVGRICNAFEEDLADSAPFLTLPCDSPTVRRGLVEAICADKRPRLPKILAALLPKLPADFFDLLDPLTPYEVTPLLRELRQIAHTWADLRFGDSRLSRLAQELAHKISLFHTAYQSRRASRGGAIVDVIQDWAAAGPNALDPLVRDILFYVARELPAEAMTAHLLRLTPAELTFLLIDADVVEILPPGLELQLRAALAKHPDPRLRQWATDTREQAQERKTVRQQVRQLTSLEQARYTNCSQPDLIALLLKDRGDSLRGLATALALRSGEQQRTVLAAECLLASDDSLADVDAALVRFLPTEWNLLTELDATLVSRCRAQRAIGLAAHLWLYRWEEHLEAFFDCLTEAGQTFAQFLTAAQALQTILLTDHCFRATAALFAQWRFRDKPKFREQATKELGLVLCAALPGPFGDDAAKTLMTYVQTGVDPALLADLRFAALRELPDASSDVRLRLNDWINSAGLGAATRRAPVKVRPDEEVLKAIRRCRILEQLTAWVAGDDPAVADEAILRLLDLGELGTNELASLLESTELPPAAIAIAATISLWPECDGLARVRQRVQTRELPPELLFEAALSFVARGELDLLPLAIEAVLTDAPYNWFTPAHWQRLLDCGYDQRELELQLIQSSQPHAYITAATALIAIVRPERAVIAALERFLEQGNTRVHELRIGAAHRLHRFGNFSGFPILLAQETATSPRTPDLFLRAESELVMETITSMLAAGPRHARESVLFALLTAYSTDPAAHESGLRQLLVQGQNAAVRTQVLANLARTPARDAKLRRVAQSFAWGVKRGRELTGKLFTVQLIGGEDLGYTRFEQPKVHINALPILRGEPHGENIVRGLILHEFGHHMYHADDIGKQTWKAAEEAKLFKLLNLVSDEHLERNLRATDAAFGDPLKRLAAYAFQHARKEIPVNALLAGLQGRAFAVLTNIKLSAARKPGHVAIESGTVLRELEKTGHSFSRFVRALRMGLGNRHQDPQVEEALKLFRGEFRHSTMPDLFKITCDLQRIFGWQVMMLDCLSQDSLTAGEASELTIEGEGLSNDELQREVKRILDPKQQRNLNRARETKGLWINVNPDEAFAPITTIEPVAYDAAESRKYAQLVRRPALKLRAYFEQLGLAHVEQRRRLQGRAFDRSRALPMVIRGEPRVLIARQLESQTDLFLGVVIDCSGSMQSGNNIEKARRFGALLASTVQGLRGVDLRVFGFTDQVIYDAGDANRCSVHGLIAGGGNNDAAALWHAAQEAQASKRRAKLLVMISDGLPTECSVAALRALVNRLTKKLRICCAQVAVRPLEEVCFPHYIELNEADLDGSVQRFGRIIVELVRKTLAK